METTKQKTFKVTVPIKGRQIFEVKASNLKQAFSEVQFLLRGEESEAELLDTSLDHFDLVHNWEWESK